MEHPKFGRVYDPLDQNVSFAATHRARVATHAVRTYLVPRARKDTDIHTDIRSARSQRRPDEIARCLSGELFKSLTISDEARAQATEALDTFDHDVVALHEASEGHALLAESWSRELEARPEITDLLLGPAIEQRSGGDDD